MSKPLFEWPGLNSDAMFKMEKNKLELIPYSDMYIISEATKGGISFSNRYSKANNKYLKSFDLKQESKHII